MPWEAFIAIAGVVVWGAIGLAAVLGGGRRRAAQELTDALATSAASNRELAERLGRMEQRLATIEKTLTDIP